jgi:hypothetical protein
MKIPLDLTPYEFITGASSIQRSTEDHYEIPDKIFDRMVDEIKDAIDEVKDRVNRGRKET